MLSSKSQFSVLNDQFFKWQIWYSEFTSFKECHIRVAGYLETQHVPALILRMLCNEYGLHGRSSMELYLL